MMPGMRRERAEVGSNIDAEIRGGQFPELWDKFFDFSRDFFRPFAYRLLLSHKKNR